MKVSLLGYTPAPEKIIAAAAKLCYSDTGAMDLMDGLDDAKTERFLEMLGSLGHESPIEHASFTFAIEGVSRTLLAQITRHRIASFSVQSQRYVRKKNFVYITPPAISADAALQAEYVRAMQAAYDAYNRLADALAERHQAALIADGMDEKAAARKAEKMAIEDARFVLPNACETKMVVTMNARSLYNFFRMRCCRRAQWEIRALATEMLRLCKEVSPVLFKHAGPSCCNGACSEGNMTCGHAAEVRAEFGGREHG